MLATGRLRLRLTFMASVTTAQRASSTSLGPLVQPSELLGRAGGGPHGRVKFVDCSWHLGPPPRDGRAEHGAGRIEGAVFFDLDGVSDHSSGLPHMLPSADQFAAAVGAMGISRDDTVVCYSTKASFSAPRVWWTFKCFGHPRCHVLDGGLEGWRRAGGAVASGEALPPAPLAYEGATLVAELVASAEDVLVASLAAGGGGSGGGVRIIDARSAGRFDGSVPEPRPGLRGGHVPGSLNLPVASVLAEGDTTTFRGSDELRAVFTGLGVTAGSPVRALLLGLQWLGL